MNNYMKKTIETFQEEKLIYSQVDTEVLSVGFSTDLEEFSPCFILAFDEEAEDRTCNHFHIYTVIEEENIKKLYPQMLALCNQLNNNFRWCKFHISDSYEIVCDADAVLSKEEAGEQVMEIMFRMLDIVKDAYPQIKNMLTVMPCEDGNKLVS